MRTYKEDGDYTVKWKYGRRRRAMIEVECYAIESAIDSTGDDVQKMREALARIYHTLQFYTAVDEQIPGETFRGHWINYMRELSPGCLKWFSIKETKTTA